MEAFASSLFVVTLAEMGDKTQFLAMALAVKYNWRVVLAGIFVATLANHLLAVLVGHLLGTSINMMYVHLLAGIAFIVFGIWTIKGDAPNAEACAYRYNPFWSVAICFFLGEMADKTQFATAVLAAKYQNWLFVWAGSTLGMMIADGLGIGLGAWLKQKATGPWLRWCSGIVFVLAGIWQLINIVKA